ncbi:MAG: MFS transporter [Anaerolineales bacterium]|nr:MFS transporter [Anaerolineales bacterium]MCB9129148.1 MFS transporter [Ardenticatenales bacterium]
MELLRNRSLLVIGVAESISNVGNWLTMMALFALLIFRGEGGVAASSGIMLAGLGPMLIASPVAGWLSDRYDRKWLMIASQFLSALPVLGLLFFQEDVAVYLLVALQSLFFTLMMPARQAAVPSLVAAEQLTRANAFLQQLSSFIKVGAPMTGGALVALVGPTQALLLDLLTFFIATGILLMLPPLPVPNEQDTETQPSNSKTKSASLTIWPVIRNSTELKLLFVSMFLGIVVVMGFDVLGSVYIRDVLLADERFFGLMVGLVGAGSLLSAFWLMARGSRHMWRDVWVGMGLLSAIPLLLAVGTVTTTEVGRGLAVVASFIGGVGNGLLVVQVATLLQHLSPPAMLGRLGGIFQSTIVAGQLITILSTPLLVPHWLSITAYFAASTCLMWGVILLIIWFRREQRRGQRMSFGAR